MPESAPQVAVIDYGMGNLFSVRNACRRVGLDATVTSDPAVAAASGALILPGVGAFGDGMQALRDLGMTRVILDAAESGKPILGICLGAQLLMTESEEFGRFKGLGLLRGPVRRFQGPQEEGRPLKIPHVCWSPIRHPDAMQAAPWRGTLLDSVAEGEYMYFVHSYVLMPEDRAMVLSFSRYGQVEFCSSLRAGSIYACQFHPERSGPPGLTVYANLRRLLLERGRNER